MGQKDPLEKEIVTDASILAWKIPRTKDPGGLQSMRLQSWTQLSNQADMHVNSFKRRVLSFTGASLEAQAVKKSACGVGDLGLIPGLGRSPGEGHSNPLRYLAWRIPRTEEPGGLQSTGSQRGGHD